ncbi:MAG TPA: class I SAM-dependent methyltransferase [Acidobacteriaceae bacterium]|nr:class I SAM-dependent methyltransferase [Acidobacteriaceae bacterium]
MGVWRKVRWSIGQRGMLGTLRAGSNAAARRLRRQSSETAVHPFDAQYGVETSGLIAGGDLAAGHPHDAFITGYAGVAPSRFVAALDRWRAQLGSRRVEEYSFVDLGCGKGRALLMASQWPFREVLGVELNPGLARVAESNGRVWAAAGLERCPVRVICADATEVDLPEGPLLVFLYNAFSEPLMKLLAARLRERAARSTAPLELIYHYAAHGEMLETIAGMRKVWEARLPLSEEDAAADPVASPEDVTAMYSVA